MLETRWRVSFAAFSCYVTDYYKERSSYVQYKPTVLFSSLTYAKTGLLFKIEGSGITVSVDVILCLNGKGPLSCQSYHVSSQDLHISSAAKHHYPAAGIKVLTHGYHATGCTPYPNGYCLFATSNSASTVIHLISSSPSQANIKATLLNLTFGEAGQVVIIKNNGAGYSPLSHEHDKPVIDQRSFLPQQTMRLRN